MSAGRYQDFGDPGNDDRAAPERDLPLNAIPSIPERRYVPRDQRPVATYVIAAAALFAIIVAVSFVAAPYLKLPDAAKATPGTAVDVDQPSAALQADASLRHDAAPQRSDAGDGSAAENRLANNARAASASGTAPPLTDRPTTERKPERSPADRTASSRPEATATPARSDADAEALAAVRRDLKAKEKALLAAQAAADKEKSARAEAEKRLETSLATQRKLEGQSKRVAGLEDELKKASTERDRAVQDGETRVAAIQKQLTETEARLAEATATATQSREALESRSGRHEKALAAEGDAVRQLLAQLEESRRALESEKSARRDAESRLRALQMSPTASSPAASVAKPTRPTTPVATRPEIAQNTTTTEEPTSLPERVKTVPPRYPDDLRRSRIGGRVLMRLRIDMWGNVEEVEVLETPHQRLSAAAERAAREWKYTPARQDGMRIATWITEAVDFQL